MSKFKVSKYFNDCRCKVKRGVPKSKTLIVKFRAEMSKFDIGVDNTSMKCPNCGQFCHFRIDTWWGGEFTNENTIYEDTAKKKKLKVSELIDATNMLLERQLAKLKLEANTKKNEFKDADSKLKSLHNILSKTKGKEKDG